MTKWNALRAATLIAAICGGIVALGSDSSAHLGAGLKLLEQERESEAAKEFQEALRSEPKHFEARYYLGVCEFDLGELHQARQDFERLLPTGYEKQRVSYYIARIDLIELKLDRAIQRLESLEKDDQPFKDGLYYLGSAYLKRSWPEKAAAVLERQIKLDPHDLRAHALLARAYMKLGRTQDAEREFEAGTHAQEDYLGAKRRVAECRFQLLSGDADQAWASCGIPALDSLDVDQLIGYGILFGEANQHDRALKLFQRALELDPEAPDANYDAGYTCFRKKDYEKARRFLETAATERPHFFEALALYGTVLYILREDTPALTTLRQAHELRPDDRSVSRLLHELEGAERSRSLGAEERK